MINTNELNEYVENFGAVIKKLESIEAINTKVEEVSSMQEKTIDELHEQWKQTLPEMNKQIEELKAMISQAEEISKSQENLLGGLIEKLEAIETGTESLGREIRGKLETTIQTVESNIEENKALLEEGQRAQKETLDAEFKKQAEEIGVIAKKNNTMQAIILIIACVAAILGVVNLVI